MVIIRAIRAGLSAPAFSPKRENLAKLANRVAVVSLLGAAVGGAALINVGIFMNMELASRGACIFGGALLAFTLSNIQRMAVNVQRMVGSDNIWTPHVFARSFLEGTVFKGRFFAEKVEKYWGETIGLQPGVAAPGRRVLRCG